MPDVCFGQSQLIDEPISGDYCSRKINVGTRHRRRKDIQPRQQPSRRRRTPPAQPQHTPTTAAALVPRASSSTIPHVRAPGRATTIRGKRGWLRVRLQPWFHARKRPRRGHAYAAPAPSGRNEETPTLANGSRPGASITRILNRYRSRRRATRGCTSTAGRRLPSVEPAPGA